MVPDNFTLEQLHYILQVAMGWQDCHMHEFEIDGQLYGTPDPFTGPFGGPKPLSARTTRLSAVFGEVGAKALYNYDFGDGWEHAVVLEKKLEPEPGHAYPACTGGKLHGPPEDCGGVPGFYNLLDTLSDPSHRDHEEMREWVGGEFNPEAFSVEEVNRGLEFLRRPARTSARKK